MGAFSEAQEDYASHGVAAFPVVVTGDGDKRPAIRGWERVGLPASRVLAEKFPDADGLGFCAGKRSKLTVLDVDSTDERVLADAIDRHGPSPIVVKTARGKYQSWYRHNGERRQIRPWPSLPIDLLGAGLVVAPPSVAGLSRYQIVQGSLDDLDRLPVLHGLVVDHNVDAGHVIEGRRNQSLFKFCGRMANRCASFPDLLSLARGEGASYVPPMGDAEIAKTAGSVWRYKEQGTLRMGTRGAWIEAQTTATIATDPYLCALVVFLKGQNGPGAQFWIADGLAEILRWSRREFSNARKRAIEGGWVRLLRPRAPGRPALYEWGRAPSASPRGWD